MSRLTARTLRKAHAQARNIHRLGGTVPQGLALLDRDYYAWRKRVQRGRQRETLLPADEVQCFGRVAIRRALDSASEPLRAVGP